MENYKLVLPEHLNHYGFLFGGALLQWVDEIAYISASLDYPGCNFVTVGMDKVEFRKTVMEGSILKFNVQKTRVGNTSLEYSVNVFKQDVKKGTGENIFSTKITFVRIDENGQKIQLSK